MDAADPAAVEFLSLFLADREAGRERPLADYLARFPGHEESVAREYLAARDAAAAHGDDAPAGPPADAAGQAPRRVGPWVLERELGRGGQGSVWLARDTRLARRVALKLVPAAWLDGELPARLRREAEAAGRLDHPGICTLYDVGVDGDVAWLAMRHVEGRTLAELLAERARGERPVPPLREDLELVEALARALAVAHEQGVLHRDIKPANVMVTPEGRPVLLDFGLALHDHADGPPITLSGTSLGTPHYMAPELLDGRRPDRRSDVWALGVLLHELVAGQRPFEAATREALMKAVRTDAPPSLAGLRRDVPRDLDVIVRTALCKEPDGRYAGAAELAEDLRRLAAHEPILARPAGPLLRLRRWSRRQPLVAGLLLALFVVLGSALAVTVDLLGETRAVLHELTQLSDLKIVLDLLDEEQHLWPAEPERVPALDDWLERARAVLARRPDHERALAQLEARLGGAVAPAADVDLAGAVGGAPDAADPPPAADPLDAAASDVDPADAWRVEQLRELTARLADFDAVLARVAARRAFAVDLERLTLEEPAAAWADAAARVAADPRFAGFTLVPQRGLVPLGPDPVTGLEEFGHPLTGTPPARDADGRLRLEGASSVVFVLVPGGTATVGARLPSEGQPHGAPFVDRHRAEGEEPVEQIPLHPFLLSRFELTQGQWSRFTGENPSEYDHGAEWAGFDAKRWELHPVERVSWTRAWEVLQRMALTLPTEAQWEYAARAGTTTPWWTGTEPASLDGAENVADRFAYENGAAEIWDCDRALFDGFTLHAPVGSLGPNPWGFCDVLGNVAEWILDGETYGEFAARPGDGLRWAEERDWRGVRGGSFNDTPFGARSSARRWAAVDFVVADVGLRPARALEPAP